MKIHRGVHWLSLCLGLAWPGKIVRGADAGQDFLTIGGGVGEAAAQIAGAVSDFRGARADVSRQIQATRVEYFRAYPNVPEDLKKRFDDLLNAKDAIYRQQVSFDRSLNKSGTMDSLGGVIDGGIHPIAWYSFANGSGGYQRYKLVRDWAEFDMAGIQDMPEAPYKRYAQILVLASSKEADSPEKALKRYEEICQVVGEKQFLDAAKTVKKLPTDRDYRITNFRAIGLPREMTVYEAVQELCGRNDARMYMIGQIRKKEGMHDDWKNAELAYRRYELCYGTAAVKAAAERQWTTDLNSHTNAPSITRTNAFSPWFHFTKDLAEDDLSGFLRHTFAHRINADTNEAIDESIAGRKERYGSERMNEAARLTFQKCFMEAQEFSTMRILPILESYWRGETSIPQYGRPERSSPRQGQTNSRPARGRGNPLQR